MVLKFEKLILKFENLIKILLMSFLYTKVIVIYIINFGKNNKQIKSEKKITHSCIVSDKDEYIKDITDQVKWLDHNLLTNKETFENYTNSYHSHTNVNVHVYFDDDTIILHSF